jgi:AraC-like DNA-binding protein
MGIRITGPQTLVTVIEPFTNSGLKLPKIQLVCDLHTHQHNLVYTGGRRKKTSSSSVLTIEFSVAAFRALAKTANSALRDFAKKAKGSSPVLLSPAPLPPDAAMHQCIYSITNYAEEETFRPLFLYARVIDLLRLQQQCHIRATTVQAKYVRTEYDKERIEFARDYLLTHLDAPPSLTQLAAIAGINEFKLKRGFKEIFNHTVFGYLADVRLEMAKTALRRKQKPVTQIAFELGYASLQHFSMAFKKKFGIPPREFT